MQLKALARKQPRGKEEKRCREKSPYNPGYFPSLDFSSGKFAVARLCIPFPLSSPRC